ncbi:MAG: hypothetical protein J6R67_04210 [Treponema sp.]|nr:hypothetical protein [Treponema sp.]
MVKSNPSGFNVLWRYFAWSNQTLALFAFMAIIIWMFENGKGKWTWIPLIPGAFYCFQTCSFILNAKIGLSLSWNIAYPIAAALTVAYTVSLLVWGKKRGAQATLS